MKHLVLRICAVLSLSIALAYSGVAWTMVNCLTDHEHKSHAAADHHHDSHSPLEQNASHDPSTPLIHCTSLLHDLGPAVIVKSTNLIRSNRAFPLHESLLPKAISHESMTDFWSQLPFKEISKHSFLSSSSRHLFLSIFQI